MVVMTPSDEDECRQMLYTGHQLDQPAAVRYPRGGGPGVATNQKMEALPIGTAEVRHEGTSIAILAFGPMLTPALIVGEALGATVVNMRFVKPLDEKLIIRMAEQHDALVTVDENQVAGGAGSAVNECLAACNVRVPVLNLGLPDRYVQHGSRGDMLADAGLDAPGVMRSISEFAKVIDTDKRRISDTVG
jgi:1-deoxy-D-xylulose-5-phosphate synthase